MENKANHETSKLQFMSDRSSSKVECRWIELQIIEARDLFRANWRGTIDPYVWVHYGNTKKRTKIMHKTLKPVWEQIFEFTETGEPLTLHVKAHNAVLPATSIGNCTVEYMMLSPNEPVDKWIPLQGVRSGEIRVQIERRFAADSKNKTSQETDASALGKGHKISTQFRRDDPGQSFIPSKSNITSRPSSGHAEASRSTHTNIYLSAGEPMAMTFQELHRITDGFSEKRLLGKGGFGMVYRGVFDNGEVIAVKKLHNKPGLVEGLFKNELLNLMMVKHQNIIRLVGYCSEAKQIVDEYEGKKVLSYREERALCLEYLQGGNLEELLSDESCELDWEERYRIIKGICQGLKHLHTGSKDPIYHLDLKPANILLDSNRIPKIGDFGLSRLRDSAETFVTKTYSGTNGYMPPEYMHGRQISSKFDVFSLGVIIIEIIAGPRGYYNYKCLMSPQEFINDVSESWYKRVQAKTMSTEELLEVQRCIKIALRCVEDKQAKRPSITEIVEELNMISSNVPIDADAGDETTLATLSI